MTTYRFPEVQRRLPDFPEATSAVTANPLDLFAFSPCGGSAEVDRCDPQQRPAVESFPQENQALSPCGGSAEVCGGSPPYKGIGEAPDGLPPIPLAEEAPQGAAPDLALLRQVLALLRAGDPREALAALQAEPAAHPVALALLNADPLANAWAAEAILEGALLPEAEKLARWRALVAPEPGVATSRPSGSEHAPRPRTDAPGAASRPSASQGQRPTPKSPPRASKRRKAQQPVTTGSFL